MSSSLLTRALKASSSKVTIVSRAPVLHAGLRASPFQAAAVSAVEIAPNATENDTAPHSFESLKGLISPRTYDALVGDPLKLRDMTSVQREVLSYLPGIAEPYNPEAPAVRDLLVRSKTGTGKTLAFLIPAIEARERAVREAGTKALLEAGLMSEGSLTRAARKKYSRESVGVLILSPTRELATQIANEALKVLHHHRGMEVRLLTGGLNKGIQMRGWMKGQRDIVVATTGRLRDLMENEPEVLKGIRTTQTLILDEADTMLDMGFRDDIHAIQQELPPSPTRRTLLFSATVSPVVRQVASSVLAKNYKYIDCVKSEDSPVHAHVPQHYTVLPTASAQIPHLLRLIALDQLTNPKSKIILFLPTTRMTQLVSAILNKLAKNLFPSLTNVYELHSKCTMERRVATSKKFRMDSSPASILVTTDISARGVDYPGVTRVIQVGIPSTTEQYVHRIGRTGRTGSVAGRGDLILLPWEIGFLTWQLTDMPLKSVTVEEITLQLQERAKEVDSDPKAHPHINTPYSPRTDELKSAPSELMATCDQDTIRETFLAMLGYYIPKSAELRVQRGVILEGCKNWSVQACGLRMPPFVNDVFLAKLGVGNDLKTKTSYTRPSQSHWEMRGRSSKNKDVITEQRLNGKWRDSKQVSEDDNPRTQRPSGNRLNNRNDRSRTRFIGRVWSKNLGYSGNSDSDWGRSSDINERRGSWSQNV